MTISPETGDPRVEAGEGLAAPRAGAGNEPDEMSVPPALAGGFISTCFSRVSVRMKPDRWQQVQELYHAALEHPAELRADFLRSACGHDE